MFSQQYDTLITGGEVVGGFCGGDSKAVVEVGQEKCQHVIGLLQSASLSQTKFADETVLKGTPQTFNTTFGLGRVGRDLLDAEFF